MNVNHQYSWPRSLHMLWHDHNACVVRSENAKEVESCMDECKMHCDRMSDLQNVCRDYIVNDPQHVTNQPCQRRITEHAAKCDRICVAQDHPRVSP